jgi:hypothetical protein
MYRAVDLSSRSLWRNIAQVRTVPIHFYSSCSVFRDCTSNNNHSVRQVRGTISTTDVYARLKELLFLQAKNIPYTVLTVNVWPFITQVHDMGMFCMSQSAVMFHLSRFGCPVRWGSARQIYGSILLQTALNMSTEAHRKFIRKLIL